MGVDSRGGGRGVAHPELDQAQVHPRLEQMGGPGVAQGMYRGWLGEADLLHSALECFLESTLVHGCAGSRTLGTTRSRARKEPDWVAMGNPMGAQQGKGSRR